MPTVNAVDAQRPLADASSVFDFLDDTMLAEAYLGAESPSSLEIETPREWLKKAVKPDVQGEEDYSKLPIWNYDPPTFDVNKAVVQIGKLECLVRGMKYRRGTVCESIEWGPVHFEFKDFDDKVQLPLTNTYLMRKRYLREGAVEGTHKPWRLSCMTDKSFEWAFGYEFPSTAELVWKVPRQSETPKPITGGLYAPFAKSSDGAAFAASLFDPDASHSNTFRPMPLRIVVVVTLICCKEADYGPFLKGGRFFPMIMVLSNRKLETVAGRVQVARPSQIPMDMGQDGMDNECCHAEANSPTVTMDGEEMTRDLGAMLFTDNNSPPSPATWTQMRLLFGVSRFLTILYAASTLPAYLYAPWWDVAFSYYDVRPAPGTYVLAYPYKQNEIPRPVPDATVTTPHGKRSVIKWPGQGEFDNLHIAPKMIVQIDQLFEGSQPTGVPAQFSPPPTAQPLKEDVRGWGFDDIAMSPFCIHDCMHMHVRWGSWIPESFPFGSLEYAGWGWEDGEMSPNVTPGAPHVPPNQTVAIRLGVQDVDLDEQQPTSLKLVPGVDGREKFVVNEQAVDPTKTPPDYARPHSFDYLAVAQGVEAAKWQIMMHHGLAYALETKDADLLLKFWANAKQVQIKNGDWAMMYWNLRWTIDDNKPHERLDCRESLAKLRQFVAK